MTCTRFRPGGAAALGCLALLHCATPGAVKPSASEAFEPSHAELTVLYWLAELNNEIRRTFGTSVNALSNGPAEPPALTDKSRFLEEWGQVPPLRRACLLCEALLTCGSFQADAHQLALSVFALRGQPPIPGIAPEEGGPSCGDLLQRACTACSATPDGPGDPLLSPDMMMPAMFDSRGSAEGSP